MLMKIFNVFVVFALLVSSSLALTSMAAAAADGHDFSDVWESDMVNGALSYLYESEVVEGYEDGTFLPGNFINRAEFVKMIVVGLGADPDEDDYADCFDDVADEWYVRHVCYAKELGWVEGYGDGKYWPGANITKTEALALISRAFEFDVEAASGASGYSDVVDGGWFEKYVEFWEQRGMLLELSMWLSPHEVITRGQMSEYLYRAMLLAERESGEDSADAAGDALENLAAWLEYDEDLSWEEVLEGMSEDGRGGGIPSDYDFAAASQTGYPYGCYGFAIKNLMEYELKEEVAMSDLETTIGWDGEWIWQDAEFEAFAEEYGADVIFNYNAPADFFFKKLERGVPMVLSIPYYIGDENVWHNVVAYSFDEDGVWIADSDGGTRRQIGYDEVFLDGADTVNNLTEIRKVKSGGVKRIQIFGY
jgi:hypothetical protein